MRKYLLIATGLATLAGTGAALAQMPPGPGPGGPGEGHEHFGMRHMHGYGHDDGAAFFRFRRGDADIVIKCPTDENVQACVTAAGNLMDKVATMGQPKTQ